MNFSFLMAMARRAPVLGAFALTLAGCQSGGRPTPECSRDTDCTGSRICFEGLCRIPCTQTFDCAPTQECDFGICRTVRTGDARRTGDSGGDAAGGDREAGDAPPGDTRLCATPNDASCPRPLVLGDQLTVPSGATLAAGLLQVVAHYDGLAQSQATVVIEFEHATAGTKEVVLSPLEAGAVGTWEIDLDDWYPTGRGRLSGGVDDGLVDGVALGMLWHDARGQTYLMRSTYGPGSADASLAGVWPLSFFGEAQLAVVAPQLGDLAGVRRAQMILAGAELLPNGPYLLRDNILPGASGVGSPPAPSTGPQAISDDLTSNASDALPLERLQIAVYYDGSDVGQPQLIWSCNEDATPYAVTLSGIPTALLDGSGTILTREYDLNGCAPNGLIAVSGVFANGGSFDGLAVGFLWRDANGIFRAARTAAATTSVPDLLGAWPAEIADAQLDSQMPQVTTAEGRAQARTILRGAGFVGNGTHPMVTH